MTPKCNSLISLKSADVNYIIRFRTTQELIFLLHPPLTCQCMAKCSYKALIYKDVLREKMER